VDKEMAMTRAERWRQPAWRAAVFNGALIVVLPIAWVAYADYTSKAVHPYEPTPIRSLLHALPGVMTLLPLALLTGWRTYVRAEAYRVSRSGLWRGPLEAAAVGGAIALVVLLPATALTWFRRPPLLVAAYIGFYVVGTAVIGLLLGLVFIATTFLVLRVRGRGSEQEPASLQ